MPNGYVGQDDYARADIDIILDSNRYVVLEVFIFREKAMVVRNDCGPHPDLDTVPNGYPTGKCSFDQNVGANAYIGSNSYSSPAVNTDTPSRDPGPKARKHLKQAVLHSRKNGFSRQLIHVSPILCSDTRQSIAPRIALSEQRVRVQQDINFLRTG